MKTLWNAFSFLAVVHLLALLGFIGWLLSTERVDEARLEAVRGLFKLTIAEAAMQAEQDAIATREQAARDLETARRRDPPLPAAEKIRAADADRLVTDQAHRRLETLQEKLQERFKAANESLDRDRAAFAAERNAWESATQADRERRSDAQFAKAVKLIESLSPKLGKQQIVELISRNDTDQAVAYLNAMNQRAATKILSEFKTDKEAGLATELLERLRTYGTAEADQLVATESSDADTVGNTP